MKRFTAISLVIAFDWGSKHYKITVHIKELIIFVPMVKGFLNNRYNPKLKEEGEINETKANTFNTYYARPFPSARLTLSG